MSVSLETLGGSGGPAEDGGHFESEAPAEGPSEQECRLRNVDRSLRDVVLPGWLPPRSLAKVTMKRRFGAASLETKTCRRKHL